MTGGLPIRVCHVHMGIDKYPGTFRDCSGGLGRIPSISNVEAQVSIVTKFAVACWHQHRVYELRYRTHESVDPPQVHNTFNTGGHVLREFCSPAD